MKIHSDALVLIFSTGSVLWVPPLTISSYCEADLRYFPFDEHLCVLKFGSWTHDSTTIQLKLLHSDIDYNETVAISQNDFMNNNEWDLISTTGKINSQKYPCCAEKYEDISFTLHIKRKSHYYGCTLVIGNLVAALITICIFLMPPEKSKRIILGAINLVIVVLLILFLASHIPPSKSNIPIVVVCPTVIAVLTLIALVVSTILLHLTNGSMVMSVPHYLHVFCLDIMGRFLCIRDISSPPMLLVKIIDDKRCTVDTSLQQKLESGTIGQDIKREVESQNRHHWYTIAVVINRLCLICYIFIMLVVVIALCVGS